MGNRTSSPPLICSSSLSFSGLPIDVSARIVEFEGILLGVADQRLPTVIVEIILDYLTFLRIAVSISSFCRVFDLTALSRRSPSSVDFPKKIRSLSLGVTKNNEKFNKIRKPQTNILQIGELPYPANLQHFSVVDGIFYTLDEGERVNAWEISTGKHKKIENLQAHALARVPMILMKTPSALPSASLFSSSDLLLGHVNSVKFLRNSHPQSQSPSSHSNVVSGFLERIFVIVALSPSSLACLVYPKTVKFYRLKTRRLSLSNFPKFTKARPRTGSMINEGISFEAAMNGSGASPVDFPSPFDCSLVSDFHVPDADLSCNPPLLAIDDRAVLVACSNFLQLWDASKAQLIARFMLASKRNSDKRPASVNKLAIASLCRHGPLLFLGTFNCSLQVLSFQANYQLSLLDEIDCSDKIFSNLSYKALLPRIVSIAILSVDLLAAIDSDGRLMIFQFLFRPSSGDAEAAFSYSLVASYNLLIPASSHQRFRSEGKFPEAPAFPNNSSYPPSDSDSDTDSEAESSGRSPQLQRFSGFHNFLSQAHFNLALLPGD